MNIRYIAIDPSSTDTGWSVFDAGRLVAWGVIKVGKLDYSERFSHIIGALDGLASQYNIAQVAIEETKFAWHSMNRQRNISGLQAVFRSISDWAKSRKIPLFAYNVTTWKKNATGYIHAPKERVAECMRIRFEGLPVKLSEHEYDSVGIGLAHAAHLERMGLIHDMASSASGHIVDTMSREDLLAAAKLGVKALVDEATEYEKVRPKDDLQKTFKAERRKGRKNV
ncbi:MAG: crossover junction endodeoxyribonuclease RuvC [Candidatus Omnitrophota bacterium]|jgi:Holliday junction resolvasome RuvABC endonuclease subunit